MRFKDKFLLYNVIQEISEGESSTIMTLQKYCKNEVSQGRKAYIYYLHSKGGCCIRGETGYRTYTLLQLYIVYIFAISIKFLSVIKLIFLNT